ncbi:isochorismatase family protein [Swaminathania salitolerans]|uniref:Isochorismatase-like domain-containing protein n=1 Tax=Swaminathania salitolerans TaxID=182838 RepID=A0A511BLZ1_9PROT|nr:isochorismatase family protein [Swaminathania salitolerans]GBQ15434.1 isochorismatase hydrolase [Swaminathania salitolerans LMG 21291]GEL01351.1 hypothetical protein SSA02_05140 [Swaminathania salitolerans]
MADSFRLDPDDIVYLFADLQPFLVRNSLTNPPRMIAAGAKALAETATLLGQPILFSVISEQGKQATHCPELAPFATGSNVHTRTVASPLMDRGLMNALSATRRRTLVLCGYSVEAVILFSALDALERDFRVIVALDACGARSARSEAAVLRRVERAGATVSSVIAVVMGCLPDFTSAQGRAGFDIVHELMAMNPSDAPE